MAKPQEKQAFFPSSTTTPIIEHEQEGIDDGDDYAEASSATLCGCFRFFRFNRSGGGEDSRRLLKNQRGDHDYHQHKETSAWLENNLKSVKEFTEVVAGPKWKNFIRKLGKLFNKKEKRTHFQYDSYSYALNFDDGEDDDENLHGGYSLRFAAADRERRPSV
ncbi:hypothetical protein Vadar_001864 [Vaccinium darrowii]|uniref:Uncharacterized protein n=1 Tax=Vaccinium darrowii TaxID=229202 RepID=A0ACB7YJM7_9ERIC|nr:hypothetical protein Vadar_001864 [Vaccinium darrowii]